MKCNDGLCSLATLALNKPDYQYHQKQSEQWQKHVIQITHQRRNSKNRRQPNENWSETAERCNHAANRTNLY